MLNAGSNPDKAQAVFAAAIKHTPLGDASKEVNRLNGWYDWCCRAAGHWEPTNTGQ